MAHVRTTLRGEVATAVTGLTTTGANVFESRIYPLEDAKLPALRVFSLEETVADASRDLASSVAERELTVAIEAVARKVSGMDDQLDTICAEVETAVSSAHAAGNISADRCDLVSTSIDLSDGAEQPTGVATLTWRLTYITDSADPTSQL